MPELQPQQPWWQHPLPRILLAAAVWLLVWQLVSLGLDNPLKLPAPLAVLRRLGELAQTVDFWRITGLSLWRIILGFLLGVLLGGLLALLTQVSALAQLLFVPLIKAVRATPVASFIILAWLWLDKNSIPVFIAFLMVMPVVWNNLQVGIAAIDRDLLEMARVYRLSRRQILRRIILPSIMPYFVAACTNSMGLAWKSGIAAEVISSPKLAIGSELQAAKAYLLTADTFAWTIVVILLSLLLENLFVRGLKKIGRQYNVEMGVKP